MAARAEEQQAFTSTYSPIREEGNHEFDEIASSSGCCCCFGFRGWRKTNHESKYFLQENDAHQQHQESWVVNKLKEVKEFSEVVAGPKWKNFVRKIGKYFKPNKSRTQCMYSPQSYALNFDDGEEEEEGDGDDLFVSFSSRFSAPLSSNQPKTGGSS